MALTRDQDGEDVVAGEAPLRRALRARAVVVVGQPVKLMERLSTAIVGAMTASLKYHVSYPMTGLVGEPALASNMSRLAMVEFWVRDVRGVWRELHTHFEDPMVKVRRCLRAGSGGQFLMEVRDEAGWMTGEGEWDAGFGEAHRLLSLEQCIEDPFSVIGLVDEVVREAISEAYEHHPQGAAFLAELARYYRWEGTGKG
ncbi:hypothetical protein [Hyphomicrobium sp. DY-1]|jgi:hypothetical protein|uniref:hypothetical protein n=1 Tax=Hyphomicrobium sp. DY-1 TaxID=3075650 RepID=UPI0039C2DC29